MRIARLTGLLLLVIVFCGCKLAASREKEAAALLREANSVLAQTTKASDEWTAEYVKAFNPPNRAKFPGNRESLRTSADRIVTSLNESSRLSKEAIAKYEQANALIVNEQQRKGTAMLTGALKTSLRLDELFRAQMRLVSDEKITDEKTFNDQFLQIGQQIGETARQNKAQFEEGRRLLGM
jgi:hypothetical protein